jgi:NAD-dependent SIR2 family protein deacetylase
MRFLTALNFYLATKAMPTATHMSLVELQNRGILTYLISQNCDGLHRRSGILPEKVKYFRFLFSTPSSASHCRLLFQISELHGNTNLEYCSKCKKEYLRDYSASASYRFSVHDHRTGRMCVAPGCGAPLLDSIINFGENLPEVPLERAMDQSNKADLHIVLGSSLTVSPACNLPKATAKHGGKLVICMRSKGNTENPS